jgi:hypothetical protein
MTHKVKAYEIPLGSQTGIEMTEAADVISAGREGGVPVIFVLDEDGQSDPLVTRTFITPATEDEIGSGLTLQFISSVGSYHVFEVIQ